MFIEYSFAIPGVCFWGCAHGYPDLGGLGCLCCSIALSALGCFAAGPLCPVLAVSILRSRALLLWAGSAFFFFGAGSSWLLWYQHPLVLGTCLLLSTSRGDGSIPSSPWHF